MRSYKLEKVTRASVSRLLVLSAAHQWPVLWDPIVGTNEFSLQFKFGGQISYQEVIPTLSFLRISSPSIMGSQLASSRSPGGCAMSFTINCRIRISGLDSETSNLS